MKIEISLLIFVLNTVACIHWSFLKEKNNLNTRDVGLNCEKFKCQPVVEPVCVKIKFLAPELANTTLKMIMINKCEMQYVKCHIGMKAMAVPMENCRRRDSSEHQKSTTNEKRSTPANLIKYKRSINSDDDSASDCPKDCPARKTMVCARSNSDIYKTFLSICHMRMYHCQHPNEELKLVSRLPCAFTAPYLSQKVARESATTEFVDDDRIFRFMYCNGRYPLLKLKALAKSITVDPRCVDFLRNALGANKPQLLLDFY